jgi:hypothetical protein
VSVSATEAAFEGFRVTRRRPGAVLIWAAIWLAGLFAMMAAMIPLLGPWIEEIAAASGDPAAISAEATVALQRAMLAFIPIALILQGLLASAVYRAVLRPQDKAFGSLRMGRDEGRVLLVGVATGILSGALNLGGEWLVGQVSSAAGVIAGTALSLAITAALIALSVRLCLIAPLTFLRRKFAFREAWTASGRMFWHLLGMTIIVITLSIVVVLLLIMIGWPMQAAMSAAGGGASAAAGIGALLMLLLLPLGMAMVTTLAWAPFAAIVRDLPEGEAAKA